MIYRKLGIGVVKTVMCAALYAVITVAIGPLAYGPFELRLSDMLGVLPFLSYFGWSAAFGVPLGGIIAALLGPWGVADLICGIASSVMIFPFTVWAGQQARKTGRERLWLILALAENVLVTTFWIGYVLLNRVFGIPVWEGVSGLLLGGTISTLVCGYIFYQTIKKIFPDK